MKTISISDETYETIKDQLEENETVDISDFEDMIGKKFFFRTVTYYLVGKVTKVFSGKFLQLENASWIPDSGRFMQAIKNGVLDEIEPVGVAFINTESLCDFFPWKHNLPKDQK